MRLRDEAGIFRAPPPYPSDNDAPVSRRALPALIAAFVELPSAPGGTWAEADVTPSIWAAMQPGQHRRLWGHQGGNPVLEVQAVLNKLAACLYPRARNRWSEYEGAHAPIQPLWEAFRFPLADAVDGNEPACMFLDPAVIRNTTGIRLHRLADVKSGYIQLDLCCAPGKGQRAIREYAHRFVYWAMCGSPRRPLTWEAAVLLHTCGNHGCLNPLHMRWGTQAENHYTRQQQ